jgi:hypothetical protein
MKSTPVHQLHLSIAWVGLRSVTGWILVPLYRSLDGLFQPISTPYFSARDEFSKLMVLLLACTVIERVLLESAAVYVNDITISIYILYKYIIASNVHAGFTNSQPGLRLFQGMKPSV